MKNAIRIYPGGRVEKLYEPGDRERYGKPSVRRASHVEPVNFWLRLVFSVIRYWVADESLAADFTRKWPCTWQARIFDGPILKPYRKRWAAIAAEREWLIEHKIKRKMAHDAK